MACLWIVTIFLADDSARGDVPLWQLVPFDRITLSNGKTHDIDPVRLPEGIDVRSIPDDEYVGQPGLPTRKELRRSIRYRIRRQADGKEYEVYGRNIDKIERYEELLLAAARRQLRDDQFDACYRHLEQLARFSPEWPGLAETRVEFHHREGVRLKVAGQWEPAFWSLLDAERRLKELAKPIDLSPPIDTQIDELVDRWVGQAVEKGDFDEARRILARVDTSRPGTPSSLRRREQFAQEASDQRASGEKAMEAEQWDEARELLEASLDRAPSDAATRSAIERLYQSHGHLRVGLEILANFTGGPADWTPADLRAADLIHLPLVEETVEKGEARFASRLLSSITKPDAYLNRRMIIELGPSPVWPSSGATGARPVSVVDIQRLLAECCRPESPYYHPALARLVVAMNVEGMNKLTIDFDRPQPRPEVWLTLPLVQISRGARAFESGIGPFVLDKRTDDQVVYVANPYFLNAPRPVVRRITEKRMPEASERLRALSDQRIDLAGDLPPRYWKFVEGIPGSRLIARQTPTVFVLQFNFRQRLLRDRTIRRAIRYAIDTRAAAEQLGLPIETNTFPTAPWPVGSFGYDPTIAPVATDRVLAKTLIEASRKKIGNFPQLRLVHSGTEADRLACEEIANQLTRVGFKINLVAAGTGTGGGPQSADIRYVGVTMKDPVHDAMTLITRDNPSLSEYAGPWLKQMIVQLVDLPNQSAARDLLPKLHRTLFEDVSILPLWQYQERWGVSKRVGALPELADPFYDRVADWTIRPGFPPEQSLNEKSTAEVSP